ncbi:MAG: acyl-CoA thioesterase [Nitrospirae bacterium]|nr:acyl-CoA thioesterase [Candidatus Manganitrophaceae bacterium]
MTAHLKTVSNAKEISVREDAEKKFIFRRRVYLSDTNAQGNVYFARFFEWQGEVREEYLRVAVPNHPALFKTGFHLLTVEAAAEYKGESKLYDPIEISLTAPWIKRASFQLDFNMVNVETGQPLSSGRQVIACADAEGKLIEIPLEIKNALLQIHPLRTKKS